jgi:hypothetical protein
LRKRLNAIPGIELPADRLRGKPRFSLTALVNPAALAAFKAAWQWAIERMSAEGSGESPQGPTQRDTAALE